MRATTTQRGAPNSARRARAAAEVHGTAAIVMGRFVESIYTAYITLSFFGVYYQVLFGRAPTATLGIFSIHQIYLIEIIFVGIFRVVNFPIQ
jgi:hypothetical protein